MFWTLRSSIHLEDPALLLQPSETGLLPAAGLGLRYLTEKEVLVPRLVQLVQAHARIGRVQLEVEGGGLDGLLLLASQLGEAVGEGIGDAEIH